MLKPVLRYFAFFLFNILLAAHIMAADEKDSRITIELDTSDFNIHGKIRPQIDHIAIDTPPSGSKVSKIVCKFYLIDILPCDTNIDPDAAYGIFMSMDYPVHMIKIPSRDPAKKNVFYGHDVIKEGKMPVISIHGDYDYDTHAFQGYFSIGFEE